MEESGGMVSYPDSRRREILDFCRSEILRYVPSRVVFPCHG
jgi:hypothetical protein